MKVSHMMKILCIMLITAFCAACGPNNSVPLSYPEEKAGVLPAPDAPRVAVVIFDDKRTQAHLGKRSDDTTFVGTSSVPEWMSRSFAEALRAKGLQVSFANSLSEAQNSGTAFIVSGVVREAVLTEVSVAELRASMQAEITMRSSKGILMKESLSASQSETGLISTSTATHLLQNTVQELLRPGVNKVAEVIGVQ